MTDKDIREICTYLTSMAGNRVSLCNKFAIVRLQLPQTESTSITNQTPHTLVMVFMLIFAAGCATDTIPSLKGLP